MTLLSSFHSKSSVAVKKEKGAGPSGFSEAVGRDLRVIHNKTRFLAKMRQSVNQTMLRITSLICAALLMSTPVFADSCSRHNDALSDSKDQKKDVQS